MIKFSEFYESIDLSTVKRLSLNRKSSGAYTPKLNRLFNNKDRLKIVEGITIDLGEPMFYHEVLGEILYMGYTTTPEDYIKNMATSIDNPKNKIRIGKLLTKNGDEELMKNFKEDPARSVSKDSKFDIILCRHPYDIAGQSTGRHWKSCTTLPTKTNKKAGQFCGFVKNDIKSGTLVAYLVRSGDNNISRPVSRVLIKPVTQKSDAVVYATGGLVYGVKSEEFKQKVSAWVKRYINRSASGTAKHNPALYYDDYYDQEGIVVDFDGDWIYEVIEILPKHENVYIYPGALGDSITITIDFKMDSDISKMNISEIRDITGLNDPEIIKDVLHKTIRVGKDIEVIDKDYSEDTIDRKGVDKSDLIEKVYTDIIKFGTSDIIKNYDKIKKELDDYLDEL